ncbi:hypothetical protein OIU84_003804 [Salix udensis]|uniref:Uncharacterized protein n=1 Tax=Salix udensis TaxID=889485 RepID=A0AAD6K0U0_9ROSI|nr:hypothetical protein OIU84_003804 [Salix udensis]
MLAGNPCESQSSDCDSSAFAGATENSFFQNSPPAPPSPPPPPPPPPAPLRLHRRCRWRELGGRIWWRKRRLRRRGREIAFDEGSAWIEDGALLSAGGEDGCVGKEVAGRGEGHGLGRGGGERG